MTSENLLRKKLKNNTPTVATRVWSTNPIVTEAVGITGNFDYIEFAAEYAAFTQRDLEDICRAAELHNLASIIKVDFMNRGYIAQKAIAAGFQGVLFVDHETPDEVRESIRMTMPATPECGGRMGYPSRRFIGGQYLYPMKQAACIKDVVRCFMIEKKRALDNIEEICSIPGVDMVQFGSADWGMNQGFNRADHMDDCRVAERKMIACALRHGVRPRCEITDPEAAEYYYSLGVRDFCLNDEMSCLRRFWEQDGKRLRGIALR